MEIIIVGDKMKKNIKGLLISAIIIVILVIVTIFIVKQSVSKASDSDNLQCKVNAEMEYLDNKLLNMLNGLNNIILRNYIVASKEIGQSTEETDNESSGVTKNSDETEVESDSTSPDNESKANSYELQPMGVLTTNKEVNWQDLKTDIEILYSSWSTIILDLYKLNINADDILQFSTLLDKATMDIRQEDKRQALLTLSDMYECIPKYIESYSEDTKKVNLQKVKSNLINAYSVVEDENWEEINTQISNAESNYLNVLNSISTKEDYDINKGYILLKELQNSLSDKDKDIFYIEYKNLLEKLNNIS